MTVGADYFDWYNVFVNVIVGSPTLFIFIAIAIITFFAAKFRFPNQVILMILAVFSLIMSVFFRVMLPITILIIAGFFAWNIIKILRG